MNNIQYKLTTIILSLLATSFISLPTLAQSSNDQLNILDVSGNHELLQDVKTEVKKCTVELLSNASADEEAIYQNGKVVGFKSICTSLVIISENKAQILIENQWYTAVITESADADGGDLDNMQLFNTSGQVVATRSNVAAYDHVILALAGGNTKLHQEYLP